MSGKQVIYKYLLKIGLETFVEVPQGASVMSLAVQNGIPCLWMMVNPDAPTVKRRFFVFTTGQLVHEKMDGHQLHFIGTFLTDQDRFVGHVFTDRQEYPI